MFALMMATFTLTGCEDVPAPYDIPTNGGDSGDEDTGKDDDSDLGTIFSEDFTNGTTTFTFKNVTLPSALSYVWKVGSYNGKYYLNASAYASNASHASEAWAVSPAIDLTDSHKAALSFSHAINKLSDVSTIKQMMSLWVSTDYNDDVKAATWTQLEIPNYPAGNESWTFVESGNIDLTAYCGKKVYIAYKYTSTDSNSGGWEINNFVVKGDGTAMDPVTPDTPDTPTGKNLLTNGDFEAWSGSTPENWKTASTAGNATLSQSTDAHGGSYSVNVTGTTSGNKRLAYKEITLKAGTYTMSCYAKAATSAGGSLDLGYVPVIDGKVGSSYFYAKAYPTVDNTSWKQVTHEFTLTTQTTVCLVVMVPKSTGTNVLIDDFSLTTSNGGLVESGDDKGDTPSDNATFSLVNTITDGTYIIAAKNDASYLVATPITSTYGYLKNPVSATDANGKITVSASNAFTIKAVDGGYTIQDASGEYYYMKDSYTNFNRSATLPSSGYVWEITFNSDKTVNIKNKEKGKTIQYDTSYSSYGSYDTITGILPYLYKK